MHVHIYTITYMYNHVYGNLHECTCLLYVTVVITYWEVVAEGALGFKGRDRTFIALIKLFGSSGGLKLENVRSLVCRKTKSSDMMNIQHHWLVEPATHLCDQHCILIQQAMYSKLPEMENDFWTWHFGKMVGEGSQWLCQTIPPHQQETGAYLKDNNFSMI